MQFFVSDKMLYILENKVFAMIVVRHEITIAYYLSNVDTNKDIYIKWVNC